MKILVAGASGYLGRHIVSVLDRRGHEVRALVRDRSRAEAPGRHGAPGLAGRVAEWNIGAVTEEDVARRATLGVDAVVSALGSTTPASDPWRIDNRGNLALLRGALARGTPFTYVDVLGGDACPSSLTRAKTAFRQVLEIAPLPTQAVQPSGFFSDLARYLPLARAGLVPLVRPDGRINPIHGADLAEFLVDRVEEGDPGTWPIGGPEVLTWHEIALIAAEAAGRTPRFLRVPPPLLEVGSRTLGLLSPMGEEFARFASWMLTHDAVAPRTGHRTLTEFFATLATADNPRGVRHTSSPTDIAGRLP